MKLIAIDVPVTGENVYYITPTDQYGQRTGNVVAVQVEDNEIKNAKGLKFWRNFLLFDTFREAQRAALD